MLYNTFTRWWRGAGLLIRTLWHEDWRCWGLVGDLHHLLSPNFTQFFKRYTDRWYIEEQHWINGDKYFHTDGSCSFLDNHHQNTKWRRSFRKNRSLQESSETFERKHWSCSGGSWRPNTLYWIFLYCVIHLDITIPILYCSVRIVLTYFPTLCWRDNDDEWIGKWMWERCMDVWKYKLRTALEE